MKRVLSVVLSVLLLLSVLPFAAAAQTVGSGECGAEGDNVTWTLDDDGTLTLSGSGSMKNYAWNSSPWYQNDSIRSLRVEEGVTSLGDYAFYNCAALEEAVLPESIAALGKYAFCGCEKITEIVLPAGLTEIGSGAFYGCAGLTNVNIPSGVTLIDSYTFCGCEKLPAVLLPEGVTAIGSAAFSGCTALTELTLPEKVKEIGNSAFYGCVSLTEAVLPEGVTTVEKRAFSACSGLKSVAFGVGVAAIEEEAFRDCKALTELNLPASVAFVGNGAFSGCDGLTEVVLPEELTEIGDEAFSDCAGLKTVSLPERLAAIGSAAFSGCAGLEEITLPASVTTIGEEAFDGCGLLTGVAVPVGAVRIGKDAFPSQAVVYGKKGSFAEEWAADNDRAFSAPEKAMLTMTAPAVVSERFVNVCGFTSPGALVSCSVDGKSVMTVTASASGKWNARLPLDGVADHSGVTVGASVTGESTETREQTVEYHSDALTFRELTLEHNFYRVTVTDEDFNTAKRNVTLASDQPFSFRVKVANGSDMRRLYVVSTKKSGDRRIALSYDEASDCWFGDGFFDENDHGYIPGTLTVEGRTGNGSIVKTGVSIKMNFLKDPAGFAYEAVRSNKVAGVTAAVYYKDEAGHELLWNAEAAEQYNPIPTLPDGSFSWAVTKGTWQIRLSKEGYQPASTEWMTVPPAQDQVFLPMVTTRAPEVESLNVYKDRAEIIFDNYMEILSVNTDSVSFDGCQGTIEAVDAEETVADSGLFYAKTFRFVPEQPFSGTVDVTVSGVRNYAGITMATGYADTVSVAEEPGVFTATDAVEIRYGETAEITVSAQNAAGKTVTVARSGNITELSAETLTLDENGSARLTVSGKMTGRERITFQLDGTAMTAVTNVTVSIPSEKYLGDIDDDGFVTSADARLALRISVKLEDCQPDSEKFFTADVNHDGAVGSDDARMILRASVGLEQLKEETEPAS